MTVTELRSNIANLILEMDKPFNLSDLFILCQNQLNVTNKKLILDVLEELCDCGAVSYSEISDDCWAFFSCAS